MSNHGLGPEPRFGQRAPRSLYADDPLDDEDRVAALFNEAWYEVARRSWRDAETTLTQLLEIAPDDGEALVLLAKVYVARGRLHRALDALDVARDVGWPVDPQLRRAIVDRLHGGSLHDDPDGELTPSAPPQESSR